MQTTMSKRVSDALDMIFHIRFQTILIFDISKVSFFYMLITLFFDVAYFEFFFMMNKIFVEYGVENENSIYGNAGVCGAGFGSFKQRA